MAVMTLLLLCAGALVTSTGSGLAVPDWPLSYGQYFPAMVGGVLYEHGHRMIAGTVGILTFIQAALFWFRESRAWVRRLSYAAVGMVLLQATLGGLTVLFRLPPAVSVGHACLAQIFFCTIVLLAVVTSQSWRKPSSGNLPAGGAVPPKSLRAFAIFLPVLFFGQLLVGAIVRHTGAGLAIPDFPAAFGGFIPPFDSFAITIHFVHRMGAYTLGILTVLGAIWVNRRATTDLEWVAASGLLVALVSIQVMMGAMVIWLKRPVLFTMLHLAVGALCFATAVSMAAIALRYRRRPSSVALEFKQRSGNPTLVPNLGESR